MRIRWRALSILRFFRKQKSVTASAYTQELAWIAPFWAALSPYAYAREEDNVIIVPPNLVYKTNPTGIALIQHLEKGGRFEDIPGWNAEKARQCIEFFLSIKAAYERKPFIPASVPYDFSFTSLPVLGEIALTYRCNNACRFCYAGCNDVSENKTPAPAGLSTIELDTIGFKKVIDIFRDEAKIPFFSFTGGEPLLRPDLEELAAYAVSRGLRVNLISNATLASKERAASLFASGIHSAQVSLEAPESGMHDYLCGSPGSFAASVAGIHALIGAGISVQTNSTLTSRNRDALLDMPEFVATLGIRRMSMNLFIPSGSGLSDDSLYLPYTEAGAFVDAVRKRAKKAGVDFLWYSPTPLCIYNPLARGLGNKNCAACDGLLSVSPSGDVLPCSSYPKPVGNLITDGFQSVWFSKDARYFKDKRYAPDSCRSCTAFTACQGACPLYWNYAGYAELAGKAYSPSVSDTHRAQGVGS
mgnify:CR=1 FL=1